MWQMIEISYKRLTSVNIARVEEEAEPFGSDVRFRGLDGNNENEYMAAAGFLVNDLEKFPTFRGRDLNSHMPSLDTYGRMLAIYKPLRNSYDFDLLNAEQIIRILNAEYHPEHW